MKIPSRLTAMYRDDEDRALLEAIDLVVARLVAGPSVDFRVLTQLERLHDEVERELRSPTRRYAAAASSSSSARLRSSPPA